MVPTDLRELVEAWGWMAQFVGAWIALLLVVDREKLGAFWTLGLWSAVLALAAEALVRQRLPYFDPTKALIPLFGADLLLFAGPRFAEGVLYTARMPARPAYQWAAACLWTGATVASEVWAARMGYVLPEAISMGGIVLAVLVHGVRYLALLGLYHALGYSVVRCALERRGNRRELRRLILSLSRSLWPMSWIAFFAGAKVIERLFRR